MKRIHPTLKCDVCGQFVPYQDIIDGKAITKLITPDSYFTAEEIETLCKKHLPKEKV